MAYVDLYNKVGQVITPYTYVPFENNPSAVLINASGESIAGIGKVYLSSGVGTSKVISSAGGKIWLTIGAVTFATAGSTIRVGLQDVTGATGLEDGAWDVYDDLVQGTDTITANALKEVVMSNGTKTVAYGDLVAIVLEFTTRNGADAINVNRNSIQSCFPYTTIDQGSLTKSSNGAPICCFVTDDGTLGHFGDWTLPFLLTNQNVASNTTPDEYGLSFQLPFACTINGAHIPMSSINTTDTATVHLIQDPLSAITNLQTVTVDPILYLNTAVTNGYAMVEIPETNLTANVVYAITYRPTNTNARNIGLTTALGNEIALGRPLQCQGITRTDLGAFSASSTSVPAFGIRISKIDIGSSGSGTAAYLG